MSTLLLNADFNILSVSPLSIVDWQNALKLQFTGAAETVEVYDDWVIRSPSCEFNVPAVMALHQYAKFSKAVKLSTKNIYLRDDFTCQYCGLPFDYKDLSKDHVLPRKHGGKTKWTNIITACKTCNHKRGHNTKIQPRKQPHKPTAYELEAKMTKFPVAAQHPSWIPFLEVRWEPDMILKNYRQR